MTLDHRATPTSSPSSAPGRASGHGITIAPPSVDASGRTSTVPRNDQIHYALAALKGDGRQAVAERDRRRRAGHDRSPTLPILRPPRRSARRSTGATLGSARRCRARLDPARAQTARSAFAATDADRSADSAADQRRGQ
jgi:DNA polymerase III alpha subunit